MTDASSSPKCTSLTAVHVLLTPWTKMRCNLANDIFDPKVLAQLKLIDGAEGTCLYVDFFCSLRALFGKDPKLNQPITCADDPRLVNLKALGDTFHKWEVDVEFNNNEDWKNTLPSRELRRSIRIVTNSVPFIVRYYIGKCALQ